MVCWCRGIRLVRIQNASYGSVATERGLETAARDALPMSLAVTTLASRAPDCRRGCDTMVRD